MANFQGRRLGRTHDSTLEALVRAAVRAGHRVKLPAPHQLIRAGNRSPSSHLVAAHQLRELLHRHHQTGRADRATGAFQMRIIFKWQITTGDDTWPLRRPSSRDGNGEMRK